MKINILQFDFDLVRYERCINAGMKPELVNATLKQVGRKIILKQVLKKKTKKLSSRF